MSIEIKNVLVSDQLDKKVVELLNKAGMNVQVNISLNSPKLISEIKVSEQLRRAMFTVSNDSLLLLVELRCAAR